MNLTFEALAAEFLRETGKLAPGKDAPVPEIAATHEEWQKWLKDRKKRKAS